MEKNKFYNTRHWQLVKVKFSVGGEAYTYAAHVKQQCKLGDVVVVPVGSHEDVFAVVDPLSIIQFAVVTAITSNMKHIPKDFDIKHVVCKVDGGLYTRALKVKNARS